MLNRRNFIKNSTLFGMAGGLFPSLLTAQTSSFEDYKAIVVVYMDGGNDGVNTFIPIGGGDDEYGYNAYLKARESIAVENNDLPLSEYMNTQGYLELPSGSANPYNTKNDSILNYQSGFYAHNKGYDKDANELNLNFNNTIATHAYMPELANLVNQGKVAIVQNVGNLIEPTTRDAILNKTAILPPFLMAHDHQSKYGI